MDDVNGPESKTTCRFRLIRQVAAPGAKLLSVIAACGGNIIYGNLTYSHIGLYAVCYYFNPVIDVK